MWGSATEINQNSKPWLPCFQTQLRHIIHLSTIIAARTCKNCKLFVNHLRWLTTNFEATWSKLRVYFKQTSGLAQTNFEATLNELRGYFKQTLRLLRMNLTKFVGSMATFFLSIPYIWCTHIYSMIVNGKTTLRDSETTMKNSINFTKLQQNWGQLLTPFFKW